MSLNDILLPGIVIEELYKNVLLHEPSAASSEPDKRSEKGSGTFPLSKGASSPETLKTPYLGKNIKHITILVHYPSDVYIPEEQLTFLSNILKACELTIADIAIVNVAMHAIDITTLLTELATEKLLVFRNYPLFNLPGEPFTVTSLNEKIPILTAPALETVNGATDENKVFKSKLWNCLKQLFDMQ